MFCCCCLVIKSCLTLAVPWTVACQASLSWDFPARILEWVAISFSRGSSQPRDQARASYIGRQILYHWATREALKHVYAMLPTEDSIPQLPLPSLQNFCKEEALVSCPGISKDCSFKSSSLLSSCLLIDVSVGFLLAHSLLFGVFSFLGFSAVKTLYHWYHHFSSASRTLAFPSWFLWPHRLFDLLSPACVPLSAASFSPLGPSSTICFVQITVCYKIFNGSF